VKEDKAKDSSLVAKLSSEAEHPLTSQEKAAFLHVIRAAEALHAICQARKGNTLFLIDHLETLKRDEPDPLWDYVLDVLSHKVRVPKPRPAAERAHHEYHELAVDMALHQFMGASSEQATRALEEDRGVDHSKLERARRRHPLRRNVHLAKMYLASFWKKPERGRAAIEKIYCDIFPNFRKTGGTK
jgi:hypothetical protein